MKKRILNTIAAGTLILSLGVLSGCGSDLKSKYRGTSSRFWRQISFDSIV